MQSAGGYCADEVRATDLFLTNPNFIGNQGDLALRHVGDCEATLSHWGPARHMLQPGYLTNVGWLSCIIKSLLSLNIIC